jgi:uncharacterized protein (DUF58 family)
VSKLRRSSRGKEAVLLFLAAFYFLIATNTQSGWLFLLSAFLLGLLAMCWHPPRRAARYTSLSRELLGSPQRGVAMIVRLRLTNNGPRPLREVLVIEPANAWSAEAKEFRWVVPRLAAGESVSTQYALTPHHRGEHALAGSVLAFGAPFGLFTMRQTLADSEPFLVYPRLQTLSPRRQRTRLAGILTEFTSPRSKGDSRSLRSLREYQSGDDLRLVHWKSSAKSAGSALLVREHHAPSRQLSLLLLDTSSRPADPVGAESYEGAITLAASLLWSAHRAGTRSTLLLLDDGQWRRMTRWEEQYTALAQVAQQEHLLFAEWLRQAQSAINDFPEARMGAHPFVITSASSPTDLGEPSELPSQTAACLLVTSPEKAHQFSDYPVTVVNLDDGHASEAVENV